MAVLNPGLLRAMERALSGAHVASTGVGESISGYYRRDPLRADDAQRLVVTSWGEHYVACCPFCADRRCRLSVCHAYGTADDVTGFRHHELWKCFNEECQSDWKNREELRRMLNPVTAGLPSVRVPPVRHVTPGALEPCEFPGVLVPLDRLPPTHPAVHYLAAERSPPFDPAALSLDWGVAYADHVPARSRGAMAQGRIIAPVVLNGVQVGWQGRYVGELNWKASGVPKYLHFFPKSRTLYGIDEQADEPHVVLVEGVTDVWRYGRGAVCGFGKKLSPHQAGMLAARLAGRPLVLMADRNDPEAEEAFFQSAVAVVEAGHAGPVTAAPLPDGTDPGGLPTTYLRELAAAAARCASV